MKRYDELDSLRGVAALTVVFSHFMLVFNFNLENTFELGYFANWFKYSPFHIFWAGHEAVMLFFILSGFVLTLPFLKNNQFSYKGYLIKRFLRIYSPLLISVLVAIGLRELADMKSQATDSIFINSMWSYEFSFTDILNHLLLIGVHTSTINPVIWSLVYEMRISIIFPFIVYFVLKYDWKFVIPAALLLSGVSGVALVVFPGDIQESLFLTIHYSMMFVVGSLLAKYRESLVDRIRSLNNKMRAGLAVCGILFYTFRWLAEKESFFYNILTMDWMVTIGASIFIMLAISSEGFSKVLRTRVLSFFGQISYSLYIYHLVVLLFFMKFDTGLSMPLSLLAAFIVSIAFATASYKFIEAPSIKWGRNLSKGFKKKQSVSSISKLT